MIKAGKYCTAYAPEGGRSRHPRLLPAGQLFEVVLGFPEAFSRGARFNYFDHAALTCGKVMPHGLHQASSENAYTK